MSAKMDLQVGVELFKETFDRDPRPTEMLEISKTQVSVLAVASFQPEMRYDKLWKRHVADKIEADWDKFAEAYGLAGCLDAQI